MQALVEHTHIHIDKDSIWEWVRKKVQNWGQSLILTLLSPTLHMYSWASRRKCKEIMKLCLWQHVALPYSKHKHYTTKDCQMLPYAPTILCTFYLSNCTVLYFVLHLSSLFHGHSPDIEGQNLMNQISKVFNMLEVSSIVCKRIHTTRYH